MQLVMGRAYTQPLSGAINHLHNVHLKRKETDQCIYLLLYPKFFLLFLTQLVTGRAYTKSTAGAANHLHNGHLTGVMLINALICFLIQDTPAFSNPTGEW